MIQTKCYPAGYTARRPLPVHPHPAVRRTASTVARRTEAALCRRPSDERGYAPRLLCRTRFGRVLLAGGLLSAVCAAAQMYVCPFWGVWLLTSVAASVIGLCR